MERALGNIYISNPLYRPRCCQSRASSGEGLQKNKWLSAHSQTDTWGAFSGVSLAASLEPLYGDCFISVPVHPLGSRSPRRMTLIFWKQSVQYWSAGMSSPWHGLIYWTWKGSLFPVIPELITLTFTALSCLELRPNTQMCTHTRRHKQILLEWLPCSLTDHTGKKKKNLKTDTLTGKDKEQPHLEGKRMLHAGRPCIVFQKTVYYNGNIDHTNTKHRSSLHELIHTRSKLYIEVHIISLQSLSANIGIKM